MNKLVTATILATLLVTPVANASDVDKLLGAAAGAAIGSTIGRGDGRTIAMVAGAVIGANLADGHRRYPRHYEQYEQGYYHSSNGIVYGRSYDSYSDMQNYFYRRCREEVPGRYEKNRGAKRAWIDGCVNRRIAEQQEYEREAYQEGSEGRRYHEE
jgi:hypothetical protein